MTVPPQIPRDSTPWPIQEPRPPELNRLSAWWWLGGGLALALTLLWAGHVGAFAAVLAVSLLVSALLRYLLPAGQAGGLVVRSLISDLIALVLLALALIVTVSLLKSGAGR